MCQECKDGGLVTINKDMPYIKKCTACGCVRVDNVMPSRDSMLSEIIHADTGRPNSDFKLVSTNNGTFEILEEN